MRHAFTLAMAGLLLAGCQPAPVDEGSGTSPSTAEPDQALNGRVLADMGGRSLTASDIEAPLAMPLHELAMQRHAMVRQALLATLLRMGEQQQAEGAPIATLNLAPPLPPRFEPPVDQGRIRPTGEAPVTVTVFCNYESPHCTRLQRTLGQVLPLFGDLVRTANLDLPLPFHRHASRAAQAAHCAGEQGNYWRFHDALHAQPGAPDDPALQRAATMAQLDPDAFSSCLDSGRHAAHVAEDVIAARSLGLSKVPGVFVNGLYASPEVQPGDLVWLIETELTRLKLASPRAAPVELTSTAPFDMRALWVSAQPGQGVALLAPRGTQLAAQAFREGDSITSGMVLSRIDEGGIDIVVNGRRERLSVDVLPAAIPDGPPTPAEELAARMAQARQEHRGVPVTLRRSEVTLRMADRVALEAALEPVPMTVDGQRQLRIRAIEPGSLYELLGLQAGDVVILVNEQPLTEGSNPLWQALEQESEVRARVIRRGGLAQHYTWQLED
ncbi:MAG: thioredoxin domain-containing protein [Steroidobacteraceae bacterium]